MVAPCRTHGFTQQASVAQAEFADESAKVNVSVQQMLRDLYGFKELNVTLTGAPLTKPGIAKVQVSPDFF